MFHKLAFGLALLFISFLGLTPRTAEATPSRLVICGYCTTQDQFNQLAYSANPSDTNGDYEYLISNPNTGVIYDVSVFIYRQANAFSVLSSNLATPDVQDAYNFWVAYFPVLQASNAQSPAKFHVVGNADNYGQGGFLQSDQGSVCSTISATPQFLAMGNKLRSGGAYTWMKNLFQQLTGTGPQAVFVFPNSDVATYYVYPDLPGVTGCNYVKGTARTSSGTFINDRGMGGNGVSNGSNYVRPVDLTDFGVGLDGYTLTCAFVQHEDGSLSLIGCRIN